MGLFTLLSVYFLIISYSKFSALRFAYIALGALCIVLAFFCKGPTGLFPLAFFLILWIAKGFKSTNSMATGSITLAFVFIVSIAVLCQWNPIYNNLQEYWNLQLGASLRGDSVENKRLSRLHILGQLPQKMAIPLIIVSITLLHSYFKGYKLNFQPRISNILLSFGIGLSATLPIMLSLKQASYYVIPAMPWFAISMTLLISESLSKVFRKMEENPKKLIIPMVVMSGITLSGLGVSLSQMGSINKRDFQIQTDAYTIGKIIPTHQVIGMRSSEFERSFIGYMQRHFYIGIDTTASNRHNYMIVEKILDTTEFVQYNTLSVSTLKFNLYKLK